jgi:alcohol dehydrogenase class IV
LASPITDSLALEAIRRLMRCLRPSILENDDGARLENLVAASMANMACTNAGLGLCHSLASPLESEFNVPHPLAVGTLLLRVFPFNAAIAPERARNVALAIGLNAEESGTTTAQRVVEELEKLYGDLGFPTRIERARIDISRLREMAMRAVTAIARGKSPDGPITDETPIICPNVRAGTVADGMRLYAATIH